MWPVTLQAGSRDHYFGWREIQRCQVDDEEARTTVRTIIAGSRSITDPAIVGAVIAASGFEITEVVCGMAEGVDKLG
jgi:hypothetical protein